MPRQNSNRQSRSNRQALPVSTINLPLPPGYNIVQAPTTQAMVNYYAVAQQNAGNIGQPVTLKLVRGRQRLVGAATPIQIQQQNYPQMSPTSPLQRAPPTLPQPQPPSPHSLPREMGGGGSVAMTTINYHHQQQQQLPPDYHHLYQIRTPDFQTPQLLTKSPNIQQNLNLQHFNEVQTSPTSPLPPQPPPQYRHMVPSPSSSMMMHPTPSAEGNYQLMAPLPSPSPNRAQLSPSPSQYAMGPPPAPQYLQPTTPPTPPMMIFNGTRYEETPVVLTAAEHQAYFTKLQELTKYKGFLREVIIYLRAGHAPENAPKLVKYEGLLRLLNNASRAMIPMTSLIRCEDVLKILVKTVKYANLGQGSPSLTRGHQQQSPPEALSPVSVELEKMERAERESSQAMPTPRMTSSESDVQDAFQLMHNAVLGAMKNPGESNAVIQRLQDTVDIVSGVKDSPLAEKIHQSHFTPENESESQDNGSDLTDLELSLDIPNALLSELKLVDGETFQIKVSRNQSSVLELNINLRDTGFPWLPPLKVTIPQDYPNENPTVNFSHDDDPQNSFEKSHLPEKIEKLLKTKMTLLPGRFTISELLRTWELCVSQACDPCYQESTRKWENLTKTKAQKEKNKNLENDASKAKVVLFSSLSSSSVLDLELSDAADDNINTDYNFDNLALSLE